MDEGVIHNVRDFADWIENFSETALVELDYGSVAGLFTDADLVFDESAKDVWGSVQALGNQDFDEVSATSTTRFPAGGVTPWL